MLFSTSMQLKNHNGVLAIDNSGAPVTVRMMLCFALDQGDPQCSPETKYRRGALGQRIISNDEVELSVEERADLKKLVGEVHPPSIVCQMWDLLDGPE